MKRVVVAGVFLLAVLAGCSYAAREPEPYRPPDLASTGSQADGRSLYLRDCAWCHGASAEGTGNGPAIDDGTASVHFMLTSGRMPLADPDERVRRQDAVYDDGEIDALVAYLDGVVEGPEVPHVDPSQGDLGLGAELYLENCAACHSSTGVGGALTRSRDAPSLRYSSPHEVAEAMLTGPGAMPVFGPEAFDERDVNSIVAYAGTIRHPDNRGGGDFGGFGPFSEGAVAWLVGMGSILLIVRLIGTRASE